MEPKSFTPNAPGSLQYAPEGYWTYHPYALPPLFRWTDRLVTALSGADRAVARLDMQIRTSRLAGTGFLSRLEAAASCRLAGLDVTAAGIFQAEAAGEHAPHLLPPATLAAVRLVESLGEAALPPDYSTVLSAHARLLPGEVDERWPPGEFRMGQTWIGSNAAGPAAAPFVPPPPEDMLAALDSLMDFIRAPAKLPDLIRLAMVHYQFGVIHPFYDANGRMSRLLVLWLMRAWGLLTAPCLPLSRWFEAHSEEMESLLSAVSRENAWEDWLVFFLAGVSAESARAAALVARLERLQEVVLVELETERNAPRLQQIASRLIVSPCITVNQVDRSLPEGNFKSAARAVDKLVKLGVLEEVTGQYRHRVFAASSVLARLED